MFNWTQILWLLILMVAFILLQIYLSRSESRWPGLILPILSFLVSFLFIFFMVTPPGEEAAFSISIVLTWLLFNIPTLILLGIYLVCQKRNEKNKQIKKMNIQDLK